MDRDNLSPLPPFDAQQYLVSPRMSGKSQSLLSDAVVQGMRMQTNTNQASFTQIRNSTASSVHVPPALQQELDTLQVNGFSVSVDMRAAYITIGYRGEFVTIPAEYLARKQAAYYMEHLLQQWNAALPDQKAETMLDKLIRLYTAAIKQDVRSPVPHLAGPPGTGKSTMFKQLAELIGVNLHVINVSRLSPLEIEGVQMPISRTGDVEHDMKLALLHSPMWTQLKEGDIVLFDEFLRGFPEVYNGLLDIMTDRVVAGYHLPKVFFAAASNSVSTYDEALRDRLLNIFVPDVRKNLGEQRAVALRLVQEIGLLPAVVNSSEMSELIEKEIAPMYDVLDTFTGKASPASVKKTGSSVRKLIGQARLREFESQALKDLISFNNTKAMSEGKAQYVILFSGVNVPERNSRAIHQINNDQARAKLSQIQLNNLDMNIELLEMAQAQGEEVAGEDTAPADLFDF